MLSPEFSVEENFTGSKTGIERRCWIQSAISHSPQTLLLFLDAELYIARVQSPVVVQRLQQQKQIAPALSVYVSNKDAAARHFDYACDPQYATFIAEELVPWVLQQHPTIDPAQIVLIGLSLSGLAAADIARRYPDRFRKVICQSPSFWWENERFCSMISPKPPHAPDYWICVGDEETQCGVTHAPSGLRQDSTQIEACEHTRDVMIEQGYTVAYRTYNGGHDPACWQVDLALALPWANPR